jgi:cystathionine gamma-lyase
VSDGDSTRVVRAGRPAPRQGAPFLPGPTFAAPTHWSGDAAPEAYGRSGTPTLAAYEAAIGELEGGEATVFSSGMAAATAVLEALLVPGDVLVAPSDAYYLLRPFALDHLRPRGVEVRLVPTDERAVREASAGATLVWVETPSNPGLDVLDLPALAHDVHAAGGLLAVDGTLAGPLRQAALDLGADVSVHSASKVLTGHSDLLLGLATARDEAHVARIRGWRTTTGGVPGPFETWLAHRSLATLALRVERQEATAAALLDALRGRPDVQTPRWPGMGAVVCFTLADAAAAQRFLDACRLVDEATSFGGVHTTAERRARWGTDAVPEGFVRLGCGVEDTADVVADVLAALDAAAAPG